MIKGSTYVETDLNYQNMNEFNRELTYLNSWYRKCIPLMPVSEALKINSNMGRAKQNLHRCR